MKIKLTYFKSTGKFYSEGDLEVLDGSTHWDVVATVRALALRGELPGLATGVKDLHTLIESPVPHMIWAGGKISTDYN